MGKGAVAEDGAGGAVVKHNNIVITLLLSDTQWEEREKAYDKVYEANDKETSSSWSQSRTRHLIYRPIVLPLCSADE